MLIRPERPGDEDYIHDLTAKAFAPMPFSNGSEAPIIDALREAGDLILSLVAEEDRTIVGNVAFSPVAIDGVSDGWFGLGPISVRLDCQRRGIGKALVGSGLHRLAERGARGCVLIGNPEIYGRMGFENDGLLSHATLDRRYVHWRAIDGSTPRGELAFSPAFRIDGPAHQGDAETP